MGELSNKKMTIKEWRERMVPDGSVDFVIEALTMNPLMDDIPWMLENLPTERKSKYSPQIRRVKKRSVSDLAEELAEFGIVIGVDGLFKLLRNNGYLIKSGKDKNLPTECAKDMGLFEVEKRSYIEKDGSNCLIREAKVTAKGWEYFFKKLVLKKV